jgi:hypothetical protein
LILFSIGSNAQADTKTLTKKEYANLVYWADQGQSAIDSLTAYKFRLQEADSLIKSFQKEIVRKEGVIVRTIDQRNLCFKSNENLTAQLTAKDNIISLQDNTIKRLGTKPKYWNVSASVGYGYSFGDTVQQGPTVGLTIGRTLFKF